MAEKDEFVIGGDCYQIAKSTGHKFKEIGGLKIGLGREYTVYHLSK